MKKYAMETTVGIFVMIGLLCVGYLAVTLGRISFFEATTTACTQTSRPCRACGSEAP